MSSADLLTKQLLVGRGACSLKLESWMKDFRFQMVTLATFLFAKKCGIVINNQLGIAYQGWV